MPAGSQNGAGTGGFPRNDFTWSADLNKVHGSHSFTIGAMEVVSQVGGGRIYPTTFDFGSVSTAGPTRRARTRALAATRSPRCCSESDERFDRRYRGAVHLQALLRNPLPGRLEVTRKLTVNLGMRWEYQTAPVERFNMQNYFDTNATNPISSALGSTVKGEIVYNGTGSAGRGLYNPTKKDWLRGSA